MNTSSVGSDFDDLLREDGTLEQCEKTANERGIMSPMNACHFRDHCRKLVQAPAVPNEFLVVVERICRLAGEYETAEQARALLQSGENHD